MPSIAHRADREKPKGELEYDGSVWSRKYERIWEPVFLVIIYGGMGWVEFCGNELGLSSISGGGGGWNQLVIVLD